MNHGATSVSALSRFPMGFWSRTFMEMVRLDCVKDWADCGMTVTTGPEYIAERDSVAAMRTILDAAAEGGIRVIVCDHCGNWRLAVARARPDGA